MVHFGTTADVFVFIQMQRHVRTEMVNLRLQLLAVQHGTPYDESNRTKCRTRTLFVRSNQKEPNI